MKGGTTSLYDYLVQHPSIAAATRKEIHFFDDNFECGLDWYRAHFELEAKLSASGQAITGEASPYYLCSALAAERIRSAIPEVRLIAILRNPVDRAISHYHHQAKRGREARSLEEAFGMELSRSREAGGEPVASRHFDYLGRGCYAHQLAEYLSRFGRDRILVLKSEDLFADPQRVTDATTRWLGLAPVALRNARALNTGGYEPAPDGIRAATEQFYRPWNERLYEALGRDMGW
jgi:hypothetical protein